MKTTGIIPYSPYSHGAKFMAGALDIPLLRRDHFERFGAADGIDQRGNRVKAGFDTIINWGVGGSLHATPGVTVINKSTAVARVVDKTSFFKLMAKAKDGPRIPEFTESAQTAMTWIKEGREVMARTITEGKMGQGILFYDEDNLSRFLNAPLFVEFILNLAEYRAHCAFGKIIYWQKKGLPFDADRSKIDMRVRCHRNGFFFMNDGFTVPDEVAEQADKAMKATPLDFVAFDIIWNKFYNKAYVLEGNSAPGIDEGLTAVKYLEAFKENLP